MRNLCCRLSGWGVAGQTLFARAVNRRNRGGAPIADFEPRILAFLCNWCAYAAADTAGSGGKPFPPHVRCVRLMCTGRMEPEFVVKGFQSGADGILILGCHPGDCHYREGNYAALRRHSLLRRVLTEFGIDVRRIRLAWFSANESDAFVDALWRIVDDIKQIGPLHVQSATVE